LKIVVPGLLVAGLILAGCGTGATPSPTVAEQEPVVETVAPQSADEAEPAASPSEVTIAMAFVPNVQFAPVYVAIEKGYFAEEGVDVTLDYGMENDVVQLVGTNKVEFAVASGDQVLLARSQGVPVVYVTTWYRRFPVALASLTLDLSDPKNVEGHTVGLPGLFGASYIGWLALAQAAGIDQDQVKLESIGFNQAPVLVEGRVDAIVVYGNNEPIQLRAEGYENLSVAEVSDYIDLVANGLITNEQTVQEHPEVVQAVVRAFLRGLQETIERPDEAFDLVVSKYVPEAGGENAEVQRQVLDKTIEYWRSDVLGRSDPDAWQTSHDFMREAGLLDRDVDVEAAYTNRFIEGE
jgi:NitT/TauT family transport system substrate-binding protein